MVLSLKIDSDSYQICDKEVYCLSWSERIQLILHSWHFDLPAWLPTNIHLLLFDVYETMSCKVLYDCDASSRINPSSLLWVTYSIQIYLENVSGWENVRVFCSRCCFSYQILCVLSFATTTKQQQKIQPSILLSYQ